jgi:orotidine-5'-phosphate decarboxylase
MHYTEFFVFHQIFIVYFFNKIYNYLIFFTQKMINNPIICAIDVHNFDEAIFLINEIYNDVFAIKLGLEFFMAFGLDGIKKIIFKFPNIKIFLDLKFHDIPNTVVGALKSLVAIKNIIFTTIHASGGSEMIKKAVEISRENESLKILSVTKLTSLVLNVGEIIKLTSIALESGSHGIVCPASSIKFLNNEFREKYPNFLIVSPGIRFEENIVSNDDQKAISTPCEAMKNGANYLVIGRPITQSSNKKIIINKILHSIK